MEHRRPLIADIKRNSLDDGPGIRSVVFFKGCPLSCVWCHNPECVSAAPEIMFRRDACINAGECRAACPEAAIDAAGPAAGIALDTCTFCGRCADECPSGALSIVGRYYAPEELIGTLLRDKPFYDNSNGGVTFSGGEPTLVMHYAATVARGLKDRDVHVLLETCGDFDWDRFAATLLPHVAAVYVDLKLLSAELHVQYAGRDNTRTKHNIEKLTHQDEIDLLVRVPLIPAITTSRENLEGIAAWLRELGVGRIGLMPYNPLWLAKARALGKPCSYERTSWMTEDERDAARNIFAGFDIVRSF